MISRRESNWLQACVWMAGLFSTCSRRQYFAVVLAPNGRVAGLGYNGAPPGMTHCVDGGCPRANSDVPHGSDYDTPEGFCIAQHAEAGALLWSDRSLRSGGTIVVNGCPCLECARLIASSGISRVVCFSDDYAEVPLSFLKAAGVDVEVVEPYEQWVIETAIP